MSASVFIGIAVTSHNGSMLNCATVDSIRSKGGPGSSGGGGGGGACGLTGLEFAPLLFLRSRGRRQEMSNR
jgi:hypothetical protein